MLVQLIYNSSVFFLLFVILWKVWKQKYLVVNNLCFWFVFFYFCYISFPCFFINEINKEWGFSVETLSKTRLLVAFYNFVFGMLFGLLGKKYNVNYEKNKLVMSTSYKLVYQIGTFIEYLGLIVLVYAVYKIYSYRSGKSFVYYQKIRDFGGSLEKTLHLRLFLYLLLSSSFYLFYSSRKIKHFIPLVLMIVFETLCNQRTTAFVVIIYFYCMYALNKKKLQLKIIVPILMFLLVGVLFVRNSFLSNAKSNSLPLTMIFGEFFQTFVTLPYIIENNLFGNGFGLERLAVDYVFGSYIPGSLHTLLMSDYVSTGGEISHIIGRGYGLANNFVTEALYNFSVIGLLIVPISYLVFYLIDELCKNDNDKLLIKVIFVFQLRLFVREGICQFHIAIYIILMYISFFYFLTKRKKKNAIASSKNMNIFLMSIGFIEE